MSEPAPIILDASVAVAVIRDEPEAASIRAALRRWSVSRRSLVAPSVFWLEVVNALARGQRQVGADTLHAVHELDELGIATVDLDRPQLLLTIDHVERYGLTAYDAAYLALAERLDGDLATLDRALAAAAGPRAISFDERHRLSESPAFYEHEVTWPNYKGASAYLAKLRAEAARPS
jgi:predicted nucleic acid-binding protein